MCCFPEGAVVSQPVQVIVESPEVLVPLMSAIANAWIATCDKRLGLFSGARLAAAAGAPAGGGAHSEGRGDVVDMLAADHGAEDDPSHEDATLQVREAGLHVFPWLVGPKIGAHFASSLCPVCARLAGRIYLSTPGTTAALVLQLLGGWGYAQATSQRMYCFMLCTCRPSQPTSCGSLSCKSSGRSSAACATPAQQQHA